MSREDTETVVDGTPTPSITTTAEPPSCEEGNEPTLLSALEDGEAYARRILKQQWFRGYSALKAKAELESAGISLLQKHGMGGEESSAVEEVPQDSTGAAAAKFRQDRERGEFLYREYTERGELEMEEFFALSELQLNMQETLERFMLEKEAMEMLNLVSDVLKPKIRWRYVYAWGIVTAASSAPTFSDMNRIRCTQRHKPAYMRVPPRTCTVPIEPNPFWEPVEVESTSIQRIQMRSEV
ncbi:uncharacterized protein TM35_000411510 [Trypanosoma theileri]|uniref:Uncharacterized protein n=1 Tax=Trypanosoma theileri TaxID=67003 RepID=A0A1X0NJL5_9TRYP|nr:uncharacterized protein TM35_000411510 [Trypanosoma theileri]ORC84781.1 hypothetical protein TM35_000411510 [Trypanosoma theileri]